MKELRKPHETDIEKLMREELERRELPFVSQFPTRSGFILDFAIPEKRIGIECDGSRWHSGKRKKRDQGRDWILKRAGWTILRFKDIDIISDVGHCADIIENIILKSLK